MLKKHSRTIGVICGGLNMLFWALQALFQPFNSTLTVFPLIVSAFGLWGSLLIFKKPLPGAVVMLISGGLVSAYDFVFLLFYFADLPQIIPSLLLVAAAVFALIIARKTSPRESPRNKNPDIPVKG